MRSAVLFLFNPGSGEGSAFAPAADLFALQYVLIPTSKITPRYAGGILAANSETLSATEWMP